MLPAGLNGSRIRPGLIRSKNKALRHITKACFVKMLPVHEGDTAR